MKPLFLQRLPNNAQLILASTSEAVTIEQLADKIVEVAAPTHYIAAATHHEPLGATFDHSVIQDLLSTVNQLTAQVQALTCHLQKECGFS